MTSHSVSLTAITRYRLELRAKACCGSLRPRWQRVSKNPIHEIARNTNCSKKCYSCRQVGVFSWIEVAVRDAEQLQIRRESLIRSFLLPIVLIRVNLWLT